MTKVNAPLYAFNRGVISPLALARQDLKRTALSAETMTNWMPRKLGSMMLRPGSKYIIQTPGNDNAVYAPFIFSLSDTAILQFSDSELRIVINEVALTRGSVSTAVTNGNFDTDIASWTDNDQSGATSAWATGGYMSLTGTDFNAAIRDQTVTVAAGDQNDEHALRIIVERGKLVLRVGSTSGGDEYISETTLTKGTHSLAFTPTGNFYIRCMAYTKYATLVTSVNVESSGVVSLPTSYTDTELDYIRWRQSADTVFLACRGLQQKKIERRASRSWSLVDYLPEDGPFRNENTSTLTMTPSALEGDITITASRSYFDSDHVGALIRLVSIGQRVTEDFTAENQFGDYIRVSGVGVSRDFSVSISGTWTATVTLQRSIGEPGSWSDYLSYTSNTSVDINDELDNQIVYYRLGVKTGNFTSGTAVTALGYASGGITGVARVHTYTSTTQVSAHVLTPMGSTDATSTWSESIWSVYRGWPSAVSLYEGRLWWFGKDWVIGSVSDAYASFDDSVEGDSAPIIRTIGFGAVDNINWGLELQRLIIGGEMGEYSCRSTVFGEVMTPTNFNIKSTSTQGSAYPQAEKIDSRGVFVQRSGSRLFELNYEGGIEDYIAAEISQLCPELFAAGIKKIVVQRQPDTRIHCIMEDGTVVIVVYDPLEEVRCCVKYVTGDTTYDSNDGMVEDAIILPGTDEDSVYYLVKRVANSTTNRYLEKWAKESECIGGTVNKQADCYLQYSGASATTITGLTHLNGREVVVWGNGAYLGEYTVSGGSITLTSAVTSAIIGLAYTADFKSTKLLYADQSGTALVQRKRINYLGVIMANTHAQGLQYGSDADNLQNLPAIENGTAVSSSYVWGDYDEDAFEFDGTYDTDSRLYLRANAPKPCTILAAVIGMSINEKL